MKQIYRASLGTWTAIRSLVSRTAFLSGLRRQEQGVLLFQELCFLFLHSKVSCDMVIYGKEYPVAQEDCGHFQQEKCEWSLHPSSYSFSLLILADAVLSSPIRYSLREVCVTSSFPTKTFPLDYMTPDKSGSLVHKIRIHKISVIALGGERKGGTEWRDPGEKMAGLDKE